jgi:hypothetical protein
VKPNPLKAAAACVGTAVALATIAAIAVATLAVAACGRLAAWVANSFRKLANNK